MNGILAPIFAVLVLLAAVLPVAQGRCVPAPLEHDGDAVHEASGEHAHAVAHSHTEEHPSPTSAPEPDPCACHCSEFPLAAPVATISLTTPCGGSNPSIEGATTTTAEPTEPRTSTAFFTSATGPPPDPTRRGQSTRAPPLSG